jgi:hypothetical protein
MHLYPSLQQIQRGLKDAHMGLNAHQQHLQEGDEPHASVGGGGNRGGYTYADDEGHALGVILFKLQHDHGLLLLLLEGRYRWTQTHTRL